MSEQLPNRTLEREGEKELYVSGDIMPKLKMKMVKKKCPKRSCILVEMLEQINKRIKKKYK